MSALIPKSHQDLLERPVYLTLVTLMPDGHPQASVVWCSYDGTYILINTVRGRRKEKNMSTRPIVTMLALDPQDPLRYLEVRGTVVEITEEGAVDHIHQLSWKYMNKAYYGDFAPEERAKQETRVIFKIKPTKAVTHSH